MLAGRWPKGKRGNAWRHGSHRSLKARGGRGVEAGERKPWARVRFKREELLLLIGTGLNSCGLGDVLEQLARSREVF